MLKASVENIDDIDEKYRDLYTEEDGKFVLSEVEGLPTAGLVKSLRDENAKSRVKKNELQTQLSKFLAVGEDPEELQSKIDRIQELELAADGKIDETKMEQLIETRLATKVGPLQRQIETLTNRS